MIKITVVLFCCLSVLIIISGCSPPSYGNNKKAGRYYNIRGFKMYCETYGTGKPMLMIHGNEGSIKTFAGIIPYFSDHYQVIVADGRSQGNSYDSKDSLSFEMMADDYAALLDTLHIDSAYIIGWSDGGINALLMAMRHPEKVKKIAASGPNLWPDSTAIDPKIWEEENKKYTLTVNNPRKTAQEKEDWKFFMLDWDQPHITLSSLHHIKCPVLVMGGDHDMIRKDHLTAIYKNIPQANLWILDNSGHGTLFEHRWKFEHYVNNFFSSDYQKTNTY
ncbi:alpha/beta fold hydrolase [Pedobacter sp. L105]|uniref:alpha/beta fold hydrolase n=1 Tax=Pedobacter sp. L105 TaxID=1641871 RepID=UPI00131A7C9E|nr:alpha/beta hydrolase [Pedobacter sp. L105]